MSLLKPWLLLPIVRKNLRERYGWNSYKECVKGTYEMLEDSDGMIMHNTYAMMYIIFIFPIMIITNILVIAFGYKLKEIFVHYLGTYIIFTALLDYMFSYYFFWKGDRYLSYFSQFEKEERQNQKVWDIMTALYSIIVVVVWFVTLVNT